MSKWPKVCLGDAVAFRGGGTPRRDVPEYWSNEIPWATVKDFKSLTLSRTQDSISGKGLESSASNLIPAGHVIIPTRMALGKAAINSIDVAINQDLRALVPKLPLDAAYLLHSMLGLADIIERNGAGATVKGITQKKLADLQIPLPPIAEQKRIAGILDGADALRAKRRDALAQLDTLLQSTFLALFGDGELWPTVPMYTLAAKGRGTFSNGPFGSNLLTSELTSTGVPVIYIRDIRDGEYKRVSDVCVTAQKAAELHTCQVIPGDVLIAKVGDPPGISAIYPVGEPPGIITQDVIRIRPNLGAVVPIFLVGYMNSVFGQRTIQEITVAATRSRFGLRDFKAQPVPLPPLDIQRRLAIIVESIDLQKVRMRAHLAELDALFASLQSRAFNGEL